MPRLTPILIALASLAAATSSACTSRGASDPTRDAALSDTLAGRIVHAYDFTQPNVVDNLMSLYAPTDPVISAAAGRVTTTRAALRQSIAQFWQRVGQNMVGPKFQLVERHATSLGPDAAVLTLRYAIPHHTPEGLPHTLGGAWTSVWQRVGGRWVIVQEHLSDPPPQPATTIPAMPMP